LKAIGCPQICSLQISEAVIVGQAFITNFPIGIMQ
jgi:hypothetical protein